MVRLTVVATVGLIGVATTGVLGMNLFDLGAKRSTKRIGYFLIVLIPVIMATLYTVLKSRRLSDFWETLTEEHRSSKDKLAALLTVWGSKHGRDS